MTRAEYRAFMSSLRADARAFHRLYGGFPCFVRHFVHGGAEWTVTRATVDGLRWQTYARPSRIIHRAKGGRVADELDTAAGHRAVMRRAPWTAYTHKRGARLAVRIARELRLAS